MTSLHSYPPSVMFRVAAFALAMFGFSSEGSPTFTANLNSVTHGDKQSVTIRSQDAKADVQGATITLQGG
jgi:hypothetical protein